MILISITITLLVIIFSLFILFRNKKIEGDYTGYQLILNVKYSGYGIAGQDLGSGT